MSDHAWELLGPNLGRAKDDPNWDAAHCIAPGEGHDTTLCGQGLDDVAQAYSLDSGYKPDSGSGCWTCLEGSNRWATRSAL